jgi:hypothetical protein
MYMTMTPSNIKNKRLVSLFLLGWILFNFPLLSLFNKTVFWFGIPVLYVFIFISWGIIIFLMVLSVHLRPSNSLPEPPESLPNSSAFKSSRSP